MYVSAASSKGAAGEKERLSSKDNQSTKVYCQGRHPVALPTSLSAKLHCSAIPLLKEVLGIGILRFNLKNKYKLLVASVAVRVQPGQSLLLLSL